VQWPAVGVSIIVIWRASVLFAAARFADDGERLARQQGERDAVERAGDGLGLHEALRDG